MPSTSFSEKQPKKEGKHFKVFNMNLVSIPIFVSIASSILFLMVEKLHFLFFDVCVSFVLILFDLKILRRYLFDWVSIRIGFEEID